MNLRSLSNLFAGLMVLISISVQAERIKDITAVAGVRSNQLVGYGLVVGLDGTGDQTTQTPFTIQSVRNMLNQFGIAIPPNVNPQLRNVAAVLVNADLPAFAKAGQTLDVTISSIGNAESLRGGTLIMTPMRGADGQVYALAQGNLVVGGFGAEAADGSSITVNIPSVGRIPGGATVEREVESPFSRGDYIVFNLNQPDFTTAKRVSDAINKLIGPGVARPLDAASVRVNAPRDVAQKVAFLSVLENVNVEPAESAAKVIVNSRTGTIVIGQRVRVNPAAVSHGSLTVTISENPTANQPNPLAGGDTVIVPDSEIDITQENNRAFVFESGTTLEQLVRAINQVGAAPGDLVAILEALKQVGALQAELIVI